MKTRFTHIFLYPFSDDKNIKMCDTGHSLGLEVYSIWDSPVTTSLQKFHIFI